MLVIIHVKFEVNSCCDLDLDWEGKFTFPPPCTNATMTPHASWGDKKKIKKFSVRQDF